MQKCAEKIFPYIIFGALIFLGACEHNTQNAPEKPRIMSSNACADQLALELANPSSITSITSYTKDASSSMYADIAKKYPTNSDTPEEVLRDMPNILLTSEMFGNKASIDAAKSIGTKIYYFNVPKNIIDAQKMVTQAGVAFNRPKEAQALNDKISKATEEVKLPKIRALIYFQHGYSAGKDTLIDDIMTKEGFINAAPEFGVKNWGQINIEELVAHPPDVFIIAEDNQKGSVTEKTLHHPALYNKNLNIKYAVFPNQYGYCGGAVIPKLALYLKNIRNDYERSKK